MERRGSAAPDVHELAMDSSGLRPAACVHAAATGGRIATGSRSAIGAHERMPPRGELAGWFQSTAVTHCRLAGHGSVTRRVSSTVCDWYVRGSTLGVCAWDDCSTSLASAHRPQAPRDHLDLSRPNRFPSGSLARMLPRMRHTPSRSRPHTKHRHEDTAHARTRGPHDQSRSFWSPMWHRNTITPVAMASSPA